MHVPEERPAPVPPADADRRSLLASAVMAGGLVAGYGAFAAIAGRYLYPARPQAKAWLYVARVRDLQPGESIDWRSPGGAPIAIARRGAAGNERDFVALSSTCPHLGCRVHWQAQENRFFCPCHNGTFDADGRATSGPPAEAGQSLSSYPLRVDDGSLYIEVPAETLAAAAAEVDDAPRGPGHDPCLSRRFPAAGAGPSGLG